MREEKQRRFTGSARDIIRLFLMTARMDDAKNISRATLHGRRQAVGYF